MRISASKLVSNALLCEDVRQEINGKFMVAGIFTNDISVKEFPASIPFMIYAEIDLQMLRIAETAYFRFFPDRLKPLRIEVNISTFRPGYAGEDVPRAVFIVPKFTTTLESSNFINFDVSLNKKTWHRLFRKKVNLGKVTEGFI